MSNYDKRLANYLLKAFYLRFGYFVILHDSNLNANTQTPKEIYGQLNSHKTKSDGFKRLINGYEK